MLRINVLMVRSSPGVKSGENPFAFLSFDPAEAIRAEQHEGKTRAKQAPSSRSFSNRTQGRNTRIFTRADSSVARPAKAAAERGAELQATLPAPHPASWDQPPTCGPGSAFQNKQTTTTTKTTKERVWVALNECKYFPLGTLLVCPEFF